MNSTPEERLSAAGEKRRDAMLGELVQVVDRTHRNRQTRRALVAAASGVALIGIAVNLIPVPPGDAGTSDRMVLTMPSPSPDLPPTVTPPAATTPACITQRVQTDPAILDRYRAAPLRLIKRIDDRTLLETLASINRPAGIIRYGDRVALTHPVDDESLGLSQ